MVEHPTRSQRVMGSNPTWDSDFFGVYVSPGIYIISCCCCYFSVVVSVIIIIFIIIIVIIIIIIITITNTTSNFNMKVSAGEGVKSCGIHTSLWTWESHAFAFDVS